ncbi:DOMON domain-containing protein [Neorhodopirellula pilleata]|uniref:BNR/Asp-box repeat protein n=1 Tax=Neorhodopirellula pilleata TaxID=2714738 RepID=A0A5C6ASY5_9BACT|nr:hypothetical protein [Neorhodopirellula pilleata]TWU03163.1 BNR/Asp-box repeat protein [Neorhodopirellula pilleata]
MGTFLAGDLGGPGGDVVTRGFFSSGWFLALLGIFVLGISVGGSVLSAANPDPFDLASINLQPIYLSSSNCRPAATLHAVATSRDPSAAVSIAVGDGGTILRSTDGGQTWNPIDRMTPLAETPGEHAGQLPFGARQPQRFGAKQPTRRFSAIPLWHFYDVAWLSSLDVMIVGGAFEPVTGISRGVCLISDDAGETWSMGNAHELPRLKKIIRQPGQPVGTVEAIGDASEASGIDRFLSYDAGRNWVEANTSGPELPVSDEAEGPIRVGQYGHISIHGQGQHRQGQHRQGQWQTVRGSGRHAAVAIVAASPYSVVWSLVGRESLHENRRVVMALADHSSDARAADRVADAAKLIGVGVCDHLRSADSAEAHQWLVRHRPAVVVLDDKLPDDQYQAWMAAIERTRQASSSESVFPQRVLVSRISSGDPSTSRHPSIWKRSSVLRADALLTGPGTLAGDFAIDAWTIAAPGCPTPASVEVATLDDVSGTVRRDIALTAGLALDEGQTRIDDEVYVAANRRLQIATARISQTANLQNQLSALIERGSKQDQSAINTLIQNALAVTASEDRTRLLWGQMTQVMRIRNATDVGELPGFSAVRDGLLEQLSQHASPASVRRWADWMREMFATPLQPIAAAEIPKLTRVPDTNTEPAATRVASSSRLLSPFQIAPVGYDSPSESSSLNSVSPTSILVPQTKPTVWQSSRGIHGSLVSPKSISPSSDHPQSSDSAPPQIIQRVNWDFHPVVMAGRNIDLADQNVAAARTSGEPSSSGSPFVPISAHRPILDGEFDDVCWRNGLVLRDDRQVAKIARDAEYWYFAITRPPSTGIRLQLDCEGNYVKPIEFQVDPSGNRRVTSENGRVRDARWYVASSSSATGNGLPARDQRTEIAINRSDLPARVHRIAVESAAPSKPPIWRAMPDPKRWLPVTPNGSN